jgi:hypothetical protein
MNVISDLYASESLDACLDSCQREPEIIFVVTGVGRLQNQTTHAELLVKEEI